MRMRERVRRANELEEERERELVLLGKRGRGEKSGKWCKGSTVEKGEGETVGCFGGLVGVLRRRR